MLSFICFAAFQMQSFLNAWPREKKCIHMFLIWKTIIKSYDKRNGKTKQIVSFYTNYDSLRCKYDQNPMIFRKAQVKHQWFIDLI